MSLIYSIFGAFGGGLASDRYGLIFHNRGRSFSLQAGHPNEIGPTKRPLHTIIPGMLSIGGRAAAPYGVMGGLYQPTGHARFVSNLLAYGQDPQAAIDAPRSFVENDGLTIETGYDPSAAIRLAAKGHAVAWADRPIGGAQAIWIDRDRGVLIGGSDPRKDGVALGW